MLRNLIENKKLVIPLKPNSTQIQPNLIIKHNLPHIAARTTTHCRAPYHRLPHCRTRCRTATLPHTAVLPHTAAHTDTICNTAAQYRAQSCTLPHCRTLLHALPHTAACTAAHCCTLPHCRTYTVVLPCTATHAAAGNDLQQSYTAAHSTLPHTGARTVTHCRSHCRTLCCPVAHRTAADYHKDAHCCRTAAHYCTAAHCHPAAHCLVHYHTLESNHVGWTQVDINI
jgi:hypothetical protein